MAKRRKGVTVKPDILTKNGKVNAVKTQARKDKQALIKLISLVKSPHLSEVDIAKALDECSAILSYRLEKSALFEISGKALALPGECWELSGADGDPSDLSTPVSVKRNGFKVRDSTIGQVLSEGMHSCG